MFDTHSHYNFAPFYPDWKTHWQTAQEHGLTHSIVIGTNTETSKLAVEIALQDPHLFAAVGIHPTEYFERDESLAQEISAPQNKESFLAKIDTDIQTLQKLISENHTSIVAIGETGLDFFRVENEEDKSLQTEIQIELLKAHIKLAQEFSLPLVLHVRDTQESYTKLNSAYAQLLSTLKNTHDKLPQLIFHCVSGPEDYITEALEMGAYISFAGNVTYPSAEPLRDILRRVPHDKILSETDAPFLAPKKYRGKPCEPWMIEETVALISEVSGVQPEVLTQNALMCFNIPA